jgi:hypothetical protein
MSSDLELLSHFNRFMEMLYTWVLDFNYGM